MTYLDDTVETARQKIPSVYRMGGKRFFDIVFVLLAAPIILPVLLLLAVLIRRDGGAAFYVQPRVGRGGKIFPCLKLRTMSVDAEEALLTLCREDPAIAAEWRAYQKLINDPRITPIGKFLRATSLDELPQFWNILVGDMSLIGPRPFMAEQAALYSPDRSAAYYKLRPGITGPWQVVARNNSVFAERLAFDEKYYATLSFVGDMKTVFKTVAVVLGQKGH
ncbi:sugar transferase [Celeribacter sp.]|uniref:sugar transferase n=1 Tax=Celeribacter sp. TaxID=1890673 RepID=UPI003A916857